MQFNELEDNLIKVDYTGIEEKVESIEDEKDNAPNLDENIKYNNEYGGFSQDGKEYLICVNKNRNVPMPWSHILSNQSFGTLVTESGGGYSWYKNSRLNRLTAWSNNPILDIPSETIYLKDDETKRAWSLGLNPMPDENNYYVSYGFGYARYTHSCLRNNARSGGVCAKGG